MSIAWMRDGGAIPQHARLSTELHAPEFDTVKERLVITPKKELRARLGCSPDVADAFCLAVWEPEYIRNRLAFGKPAEQDDRPPLELPPEVDERKPRFDPYARRR
jgi:hypothetical protein